MLMMQAYILTGRSTCDRARVGCVIAKGGRVLAAGYNGSTPASPHCDEYGHRMVNGHCIRTVHSEVNAIANAARNGVAIEGSTLYCTHRPCKICIKQILCAGISRIVYSQEYDTDDGIDSVYIAMIERASAMIERIEFTIHDLSFINSLVDQWQSS